MNRVPKYNPETLRFECFCKSKIGFTTLQKYKSHCKSQGHQQWKEDRKINDDIEVPLCSACFDPISDPEGHSKVCYPAQTINKEDLERQMQTMKDKIQYCAHCGDLILMSILANARKWQNRFYCAPCFNLHFQADESQSNKLVKLILLHQSDAICVLCSQPVFLSCQSTIFEHVNPFLKTSDPTALLGKGENPLLVSQDCLKQGIRIVHRLCAQLKTLFEVNCQQIASKKKISKLKNISEERLLEMKTQKSNQYDQFILPSISSYIKDWIQDLPLKPTLANKRKRKRVMTNGAGEETMDDTVSMSSCISEGRIS